MVKNTQKIMLFGMSIILLGILFSVTKSVNYSVTEIALGLFGIAIVLSGFFSKD